MTELMTKIAPYINFQKGKAPSLTYEQFEEGLKPYLSPEYLRGTTDNPLFVQPNGKLVEIDGGEIIVLWDGSNAGEIFISKKGILASTMTKLIVNEDEFDRCYFTYSMKYLEYILKAKTAGSGIPHVDKGVIKNLRIFKPTKSKQQKIASILTKVDDAIQAVQNTVEKAERLKKALMQNLLTGKLKPDGTWRRCDEFYEDEKFGKVPIGWVIKKGNKITEKITKGQSPKWQGFDYQSSGSLFITSENVRNGTLDISNPKYVPEEFNNRIKGSQLVKGDILINIVGASIGRSCIYDLDIETANINQAVCLFRPKEEYCSKYLLYYLQHPHTINSLLSNRVETARANLSLSDFRKFKFLIPEDFNEQILIEKSIGQIEDMLISKKIKIQKSERVKKALMQNLLTGKVRVKIDELIT